jgi:hypothetical protein
MSGDYEQKLLIALALKINVSARMARRIALVSPVNQTAFLIPDISTMHRYYITG